MEDAYDSDEFEDRTSEVGASHSLPRIRICTPGKGPFEPHKDNRNNTTK